MPCGSEMRGDIQKEREENGNKEERERRGRKKGRW
jgi:hypothetical protein